MEASSMKKYAAEAFGTFVLTLFGCGSAAVAGATLDVYKRQFLPREDAEIAAAVLDSVEGRGIRVIRGAGVRRIDDEADQAVVTVEISGAEERRCV